MNEAQIKNVFLAEDDEEDVLLFESVLSELDRGIIVTVATDGNVLMDLLKQAILLPEIIFLDLNMPHKNGFECLSEIKSNARWNSIKIVILSTSSQAQQIEIAYKGGADLYLAKPVSYTLFKNMLEKCLNLDWEGLKESIYLNNL
jgi:CheY-like chemotaxis protein